MAQLFVVDDDHGIVDLITEILGAEGREVAGCTNRLKAVGLAQALRGRGTVGDRQDQ
jgi:hypothetical protein